MNNLVKIASDLLLNSLILGAWLFYGLAWPSYIVGSLATLAGFFLWVVLFTNKTINLPKSKYFYPQLALTTVFIALYAHFGLMFMAFALTISTTAIMYFAYKK